jgi:GntR family transcriptional regulator
VLDKNSSTPIYIQLKYILKHSILSGEVGQNQMIPSETQLANEFQITRTTVRRAIAELVNENILRKEHGKGTFVSLKPVIYSMWNFSSFTDYIQRKDKIPVSKILTAEILSLDGKSVFKLERARGVKEDGQTLYLTIDLSIIPLDLFPDIMQYDFENRSLYEVMRREYGINPDHVELSIQTQMADKRVRHIFGLSENGPLLVAQGQVFSKDNQQIETIRVTYGPNVDFKLTTRIASDS